MSGDMNTALGNCILMIAMVLAMFKALNIIGDILDDGDDCLVILESEDVEQFCNNASQLALEFGMELKIENVANEMVDVEWCQCHPIPVANTWKFIRNPYKIFNTSLVSSKWVHMTPHQRLQHLRAIGECELVLNNGVPVLESYAHALIRNSRGVEASETLDEGDYRRMMRELKRKEEQLPITFESRCAFERAFGIRVEIQLLMEDALDSWEFELTGEETWPCPVTAQWDPTDGWGAHSPLG